MSEEREIDLIDLVMEVLKHWKGAIVFMLIGAICMGAYSYMHSSVAVPVEMTYAEKKAVDVALEFENMYMQTKKSNDIEMLIQLERTIIDSVKGFTEQQQAYFMENSQSDLWMPSSEELEAIVKAEQEVVVEKGISKKLIAIGAIAFCFMYFCIWAVLYIFDGHIKSSDDMESLVNVSQLGRICTVKEPGFFIDKIIFRLKHHGQRIFEPEKSVELIASNLSVNAKKKNISSISIVGCNLEKKAEQYCKMLVDNLKDSHGIDANVLDDIVYNQKAVEALADSQSVVLVETVGNTLYSDLDKEIKLINQLDIIVLGGVIVE